MVSCKRVRASLGEYVANELSSADRHEVEGHLALCAACSLEAEAYREVIRLARSLPPLYPPPDVERRLRKLVADVCRPVSLQIPDQPEQSPTASDD